MRLSFKEWLTSTPEGGDGAGEIWDSRSNADREYGKSGVRSRYVGDGEKSVQSEFDPDELFLGKRKKKVKPRVNTQAAI
jgi:hypothetical protein